MKIKDFLNQKVRVNISSYLFTSGLFETTEKVNKEEEVSKEEKRLTNAQSRRMYPVLLILIGIYVLYMGIQYLHLFGIILGLVIPVIGYILFNYLQKRIRVLEGQVTYKKVPTWYRFVSLGSTILAYASLYFIIHFLDGELGLDALFMIPYVIGLTICSLLFLWSLFIVEKKKYNKLLSEYIFIFSLCLFYGMYLFLIFSN